MRKKHAQGARPGWRDPEGCVAADEMRWVEDHNRELAEAPERERDQRHRAELRRERDIDSTAMTRMSTERTRSCSSAAPRSVVETGICAGSRLRLSPRLAGWPESIGSMSRVTGDR